MEMTPIYSPLHDLLSAYSNAGLKDDLTGVFKKDKRTRRYQLGSHFLRYDNHLRDIWLILNRIREDAGMDTEGKREKPFSGFHEIQLDLESLLLFIRITMDDIAGFVPLFYPTYKDQIPPHSFNDQKKWFLREPGKTLDPDWAKYLEDYMEWFEKLRSRRDDHVHHDLWAYVDHDWATDKITSIQMESSFKESEIPDLLQYVADLYSRFFEFLKDFEDHFSDICAANIPNFDLQHLSVQMVEDDWLKTIRYFLTKGNSRVYIDLKE